MPSECPVCHKVAVDAEEGGELVCTECGAVVEGRVFNCEVDKNGRTLMSANGTARFDGRYDLPSEIRQRLPTGDTLVSKKGLQKFLYLFAKRMKLSNEILNEAREFLFTTVIPKINSREIRNISRHQNIVAGSCLFIVSRQNNMQLTYRSMAEIVQCNMFSLGRSVKIILNVLGIHLEPVGAESSLMRVLAQLSVVDKPCEKMCLDLLHTFKYFGLGGTRNVAFAIALALIVLESQKISLPKEKIAEVLGKNSLTDSQLRTQMTNTRRGLMELAKDVPWIPKSVRRKDIARHTVDIIDFHKKCGKVDLSAVKSLGMKKKELEENNRKRKIQMAKARIDKEKTQQQYSSSEASSGVEIMDYTSFSGCSSTNQSKDRAIVLELEINFPAQTLGSIDNGLQVAGLNTNHGSNPSDVSASCRDDDLDENDALIEQLLRSGYSEEELMDGYFESRLSDLQGCDPQGEREDLDELDIGETDMHIYLWSVAEVERIRNLRKDDSCQELEQSQQKQG